MSNWDRLAALDYPPVNGEPEQRCPALRVLTVDEVLATPDSKPLIAGIMDQGTLAMLYGPPGSGKSFVALDLGLAITGGAD